MAQATLRQLLEAGVHFGHRTSRWNPKMKPYIFTARNGLHIIDLEQTQVLLDKARDFVRDVVANGDSILFVGTKKQAQDVLKECCEETGQYYIIHRWMGGTLTNFTIIQQRLKKLADIREMKERGDFQRMVRKEANKYSDELDHLENNLGGMSGLTRLPGAMFVVDTRKEKLAVAEATKLGIPIIAISDTNCDPLPVKHVIPGNDDAIRSIRLVVNHLKQGIVEGKAIAAERAKKRIDDEERVLKEKVLGQAAVETESEAVAAVAVADKAEGE